MKKFSKYLALALALVMVLGLAACNKPAEQPTTTPDPDPSPVTEEPTTTPDEPDATAGYKVAMITDIGEIDDKSFNQGTWEGIVAYCEGRGIEHKYFKPLEQSDNEYLNAITTAIESWGATIVVTPGYLFEVAIYQAQQKYPKVNFMLIDGTPNDGDYSTGPNYETRSNTVSITYAEEQAGFLAGYAAVKDGATSLGFMGGMAVPAVIRFGHGYIQGADYAATEMGITVEMKYHYTGGFAPTPEAQNMANSWFTSGTDVIFACGGGMGNSVMNAGEATGKYVIGVDIDQGSESTSVVNSSVKGLAASVELVLDQYFNGSFPGGENLVISAADNGVGLAMESNKFENFGQADYDAIYAELAAGNIPLIGDTNDAGETLEATDIEVMNVNVTLVK